MKRSTLLYAILAAMLAPLLPLNAQQKQDALYIYRNDGGFHGFFFGDIDRIEYSKTDTLGVEQDDYVVQEIYALDSLFRIPLSAIDSVTFVTPETVYKPDVVHTTESDLWNYVIGSDSVSMLKLATNTPTGMIPKVGDKIVTTKSREFLPGGFYGLVKSVQANTGGYLVCCDIPPLIELFDQFVCKAAIRGVADDGSGARSITRSENAFESDVVLPGKRLNIDLRKLGDLPYSITDQWSVKGTGALDVGFEQTLRTRLFVAVRWPLGFNYDCVSRLQTTTWLDLTLSGEVSGQFDIPLHKSVSEPKVWIPDTPFTIECEFGLSSSISGKVEFNLHRKYVASCYQMLQYNDSFYDEEHSQSAESFHTLANESKTSLTGEATISAGPYFGVYCCFIDKRISKVGLRGDMGMKATVKAELSLKDYLLGEIPGALPAYMLLAPTPMYDLLNRDASVSWTPFLKCDFEAQLAQRKEWKYTKTLFDEGTLQYLFDFDMGLKFEGGLVPEFKNTALKFDSDMVPTASVDIRRPALFYPPVGFAAYYKESGKQLGSTLWKTNTYKESELKNYSMKLPKFGGGKEVRVYPIVKMLRKYDLLASPYASYTVPAEMTVKPDLIETIGDASENKFTVTDNLDWNEDEYTRNVEIDFGKDVEPWFTGKWVGNDYVINISKNEGTQRRTADVTFTTSNKNESVKLEKTVTVKQEVAAEDLPTVSTTEIIVPRYGGTAFVAYTRGEYATTGYSIPNNGWLTGHWGYDNVSPSRYPRQLYLFVAPNTTGKERVDTVQLGWAKDSSVPMDQRYIIKIVVKQEAGPSNLQEMRNILVGTWEHFETGEVMDMRSTFVFNADGTYRRDVIYTAHLRDHDNSMEVGTYEVTKYEQTKGANFMRIYLKLDRDFTSYKDGSNMPAASHGTTNIYLDITPHFIEYLQFSHDPK